MNNVDWYEKMIMLDFLSTIGRQFRVGQMLAKTR